MSTHEVPVRLQISFLLLIGAFAAWGDLPPGANPMCPVTTDEPVDVRYGTRYGDRTVYFCCDRCLRKFIADPTAYAHSLPPTTSAASSPASAPEAGGPRFGRLHAAVVHFPVALILSAGLAETLSVLLRRPIWSEVGRYTLHVGALGAAAAAPLGWLAAGPPGADPLIEWHRWLGLAALAASAAAAWASAHAPRLLYRALLTCAALLVMAAGHFGGALTHGTPAHPLG